MVLQPGDELPREGGRVPEDVHIRLERRAVPNVRLEERGWELVSNGLHTLFGGHLYPDRDFERPTGIPFRVRRHGVRAIRNGIGLIRAARLIHRLKVEDVHILVEGGRETEAK